jgi:hypothetical protein
LSAVLRNARIWKADFVIIYEKAGSELDPKWKNAGFMVLDKFSWIDQENELRGIKPYKGMVPDWWLLKVPEPLQSLGKK